MTAFLAVLGPGLLAGLSDDDPAGITTYSILGADYGYQLLWVVVLSTAMLVFFHLLAVRLGTVTGEGFAAVIRRVYGKPWALAFAALFVVANSGTICAEFAGIVAAASLAHVPAWAAAMPAAGVLCVMMIDSSFRRIEHILVALSCVLASYIAAGALAHPDWSATARGSVLPTGFAASGATVAIAATIGTTLAPWGLAFIQSYAADKGLRWPDYRLERIDVIIGALLTGIIGVFIVVACAATLHAHGVHIRDARDAAEALRPFAGRYAATLFGIGLLGAAVLAAAIVPLATALLNLRGNRPRSRPRH